MILGMDGVSIGLDGWLANFFISLRSVGAAPKNIHVYFSHHTRVLLIPITSVTPPTQVKFRGGWFPNRKL